MFRLNRRYCIGAFIILFFTLLTASSMALVMIQERGRWPENWPKELEPYRTKAKTIEIAAGNQESVYEIFFQDRADFENIWPTILELKDKGAPIRLKSIEKSFDEKGSLFNNTKPLVRIFAHVYPAWPIRLPGGKELVPGPPWPESAKTTTGQLPEYVTKSEDGSSWVPAEGREHRGFIYRARTDIELVVDGRVIDVNRIRLPTDALIIDQCKLEMKNVGQDEQKAGQRTGRNELELTKEENAVLLEFQQALKKSDWKEALSCCSDTVRSKAAQYNSEGSFFKDTVPVKEITNLPAFRVSGSKRRDNKPARYISVDIEEPNSDITLEWNLYTVSRDAKWFVDFDTKPFEIWKKHEVLKLKWINGQLKIDPEKIREGFKISLIPLGEDFIIGKPMLFRLEMKNTSKETLGYMYISPMANNKMIVKDSNGNDISYVDTSSQTALRPEFIEPGETVVFADNYDVRSQYHIVKPGKYTFQFRGLWDTKSSNIVEATVLPGQLSPLEDVVENLKPILPQGWELTRRLTSFEKPEASREGKNILISLVGKQPDKAAGDAGISIRILLTPSNIPDEFRREMELWGKCEAGFVYVKAFKAEQLWPNYKEQIINALKIQVEYQNAAGKGKGK